MIKIIKHPQPKSLQSYKKLPNAEFDGPNFTVVKDKIRESLLLEQGYLCAYCMRRISDSATVTKVEHWVARTVDAARQLDYKNLLACCNGYEGSKAPLQTCDTRKGDKALKYNPADLADDIDRHIDFKSSGKVSSNDGIFNQQLNEVLNLNIERLVKNRIEVLEELQFQLSRTPGARTKAELNHMIQEWSQPNAKHHLREYCGVVLYDLKIRERKAP